MITGNPASHRSPGLPPAAEEVEAGRVEHQRQKSGRQSGRQQHPSFQVGELNDLNSDGTKYLLNFDNLKKYNSYGTKYWKNMKTNINILHENICCKKSVKLIRTTKMACKQALLKCTYVAAFF
jgi:hypothetical protein